MLNDKSFTKFSALFCPLYRGWPHHVRYTSDFPTFSFFGKSVNMRITYALPLVLASMAFAAPTREMNARATGPTVYLAGDSTMALGGGGSGTQGQS